MIEPSTLRIVYIENKGVEEVHQRKFFRHFYHSVSTLRSLPVRYYFHRSAAFEKVYFLAITSINLWKKDFLRAYHSSEYFCNFATKARAIVIRKNDISGSFN
jgi:hypothetical protein